MLAFSSSFALVPYFEVAKTEGWFMLLSNDTEISFVMACPTRNERNESANSFTEM